MHYAVDLMWKCYPERGLESNPQPLFCEAAALTAATVPQISRRVAVHRQTEPLQHAGEEWDGAQQHGTVASYLSVLSLMSTLSGFSSQAHKTQVAVKLGLLFACTLWPGVCACVLSVWVSVFSFSSFNWHILKKKKKKGTTSHVSARLCSASITKLVDWILF